MKHLEDNDKDTPATNYRCLGYTLTIMHLNTSVAFAYPA